MKTRHAGLAPDPEKFRTRWMRADRRAEYEKAAGEREARRAIARARPTLPTEFTFAGSEKSKPRETGARFS